jgi:TetR/AcrR family transcriptional repressor of nem operon
MPKRLDTKERLIGTTLNLIWSQGFSSVSVGDICKKTGINKGSFYHFFPSKTALGVAALETAGKIMDQELDAIFNSNSTVEEIVDDLCKFLVGFQNIKRSEVGMVCGCPFTSVGLEQSNINKEIAQTAKRKLDLFKAQLLKIAEMASARKLIKPSQVELKAEELFSCYLGTFVQIRLNNDLKALENMKSLFSDILCLNRKEVIK